MKATIKLANQSGTGDYRQCLPFSVEYGLNVSECVRSMGVPSETTAGSDFCFSVGAEMLVRRYRVCSLSTHIPSKEAWSFHTPPAIQVLYDLVPHLSGI